MKRIPSTLALGCLIASSYLFNATAQPYADNFNDGNDAGWTQFAPVAGSTFTFPASSQGGLGYQLTSPPASPAGRVGSVLTSATPISDFIVTVDLVDWNNSLRQEMGMMARVQPSPSGLLPTGYSMIYVNRFSAGAGGTDQLRIYRDGAAEHSLLTGSQGQFAQLGANDPAPPNPALADYRLVFGGQGSAMWGQVLDLGTGQPLLFSTGVGPLTNTIWAVDTTYTTGVAGLISVAGTASDPSVNPVLDNFTFQAVPEPSTVALVAMGFTGLCFAIRRRRQD